MKPTAMPTIDAAARPGAGRRLLAVLLAASLALGACAQASRGPVIDANAPGLGPDQRTVRQVAAKITPEDSSGGNVDWFSDNAVLILAGVGCVLGASIGGSARDCLTGAAIGGLGGALARITVLDDRDSYADDEAFVAAVSDELDRVLAENDSLVPAAERLADQHSLRLAEIREAHAAGRMTQTAARSEVQEYLVDEQALRLIVQSNDKLLLDIDRALTGVNVPTIQQQRLQDQEGAFLADAGRIKYAQQRLTEALAGLPPALLDG